MVSKKKALIITVILAIVAVILYLWRNKITSFFKGLGAKVMGQPAPPPSTALTSGLTNVPVGPAILTTQVSGSMVTVSGTINPIGTDIIQIVVGDNGPEAIACIYNGVPPGPNTPISAQVATSGKSLFAGYATEYTQDAAMKDYNSGKLKLIQIA